MAMLSSESSILSSSVGWIILAVLSVLWITIGVLLGRKAKNMDGYMVAGRNVGLSFGIATAMATWVTSNTTMLAPQFALEMGIWGMLAYSTASFGLFLFAPAAQRIKALMPKGLTSGDFIRLRYGRPTWKIFLVISIFYGMTWLISMGMAGGILMNAISGIPYEVGMTVILFVCIVYTVFGGLYAVIGTDFIQSVLILIGVVVVGIGILSKIEFSTMYNSLRSDHPMLVNAMMPAAIMAIFNNMLFGIGEVFHSNVWWSRAFAMREKVGKKAYFIAGLFWFPVPIAAGFIALSAPSLGLNITSADMVGPFVASRILGWSGSIVVFIVLFCSLASSMDSLLAAMTDLITEDIYRKMFRPLADERKLRRVSLYILIGIGLITWLICLPRIGSLATVLFFAGPMVASTIWPIATGLYWKRAGKNGATWAMLLGTSCGLISYFTWGWFTASLVGAAVSMIVVVTASSFSTSEFEFEALNEKLPTDREKEKGL